MSERFQEKDFSNEGLNFSMWKKVLVEFKPYVKYIIVLMVLNTIIALSDVLLPIMNKNALDEFVGGNNSDKILGYALIYLSIILVTTLCHIIYFVVAAKTENGFSYDLRKKLFIKLQNLSFSYYDVTPSGWLMSRMTSDIFRLSEILTWSFAELFWGLPLMIFTTVVMFRYSVKLTLLVLVVVPLLALVVFYFQKRIMRNYREVRKYNSIITNAFNESINGAKTTKTLVLEDSNFSEFKKDTDNFYDVSFKAGRLSSVFRPLVNFISSISLAFILWLGGQMVFDNMLSFGVLYIFITYSQQFFEPLRTIAILFQDFQMAQASGERIISLLESEIDIKDSDEVIEKYGTILDPKTQNYEDIKGDVEFKHVGFKYKNGQEVLNDFNLKVEAGKTVAIVGQTGAGKSTIVNLLCRFYEPTKGELLIDGIDYRKRSLGWLHSKLGYVLQAPHLFEGTIEENIRYGNLDATKDDIIMAAKLVNAHDFIMSFKDGYDTFVGEGGSRLSTGQKQLISFARAVLAKPSIFILDEATASIDTETEKIIQFGIENIMKGKTSFVIAHRLSTIVNADRILVIDRGKIIEDGNHESLMKQKGNYYRLFTNQFKESLEKI